MAGVHGTHGEEELMRAAAVPGGVLSWRRSCIWWHGRMPARRVRTVAGRI